MGNKFKKIWAVLILTITVASLSSTIFSSAVLANTNEKIILKKDEKEFLIYYKEYCNEEFQFAISSNNQTSEEDLNFRNSAKDQSNEASNALNIAYINEEIFNEVFSKDNTEASKAYIWIKNENEKIVLKKDEIDFTKAVSDEILTFVNETTKADQDTSRIKIDTTKTDTKYVEEEGIETSITTGKISVFANEGSTYYYNLIKVSENAKATELYSLAENMQTVDENAYSELEKVEKFYNLYNELMPSSSEWTKTDDGEIKQPESARTGDKYLAYIKEVNAEGEEIIDVKLLVSVYEQEEKRISEEDKTITETVKLPVTFDSGVILFIVFFAIIVALVIVLIIKNRTNKKEEK